MDGTFGLAHIALILFLTLLGGLFVQRLRQPALIGYMLVGAIVGPGLLGLQGENETIRWLSELAIILLMFLIGMELDMRRARTLLIPGLSIAIAQAVFSLAVMFGFAFFLDWSFAQAILFGFIVALSSTAVAVTMLNDLRGTDTTHGQLVTAILVAQDLLVVPMLLVISALGGGFDSNDIVRLTFAAVVIVGSLLLIYRLTTTPGLVTRLEAFFTRGTSQPFLTVLALCFGAAALSGALGLSTAYGAFALGLLIGNLGTVGASYRTALHPFHDFLMALFFLSIGLMLDITTILENLWTIGFILLATLFLKTFGNLIILKGAGLSTKDSFVTAATLGQVGEFSFVLISLGLNSGFIDRSVYEIGLTIIALSLVVSPLWLSFVRTYLAHRSIFPHRTGVIPTSSE